MRLAFDRGTLVLSEMPAGLDPGTLPGVLWDPRTGECRAPAFVYPELVGHLARCGARVDDAVPMAVAGVAPRRAPELRPYQQSALDAWELAGRRGVVALPTGSGKTRLALAAIAATRAATLVLVPTRVLLGQWVSEIAQRLDCPVGCYGDGEHRLERITVATFESGYRHMASLGNRFALLILDEAHHFGSAMREDALVMSTAPMRLGLTATAPRDGPATARLNRLVGPVVYELGVADLTGEYLSEFDIITLTLPLSPAERAAYELDRARFRPVVRLFFHHNPEASWRDFVRAARQSNEGREALEAWQRAQRLLSFTEAKAASVARLLCEHRDTRTLVFTADNDAAYAIARAQLVMPITCDISRREREVALAGFRSGALRVLVSARVLNEGIDVPDADVAIIAGGGGSERQHVQRVGRLLRPAPGKRARVFELVTEETSEVQQSLRRQLGLRRPAPQAWAG
jgi:superfamily II DNA or RNA helicase